MRDDLELIEVIEADPSAFGPAPRSRRASSGPEVPDDGGPSEPPPLRSWPWITAVAVVMVALVAGLLAWSPWWDTIGLALDDPRPTDSELTERLVFDAPPSELRAAVLASSDPSSGDTAAGIDERSVGYFFAEPGATFEPDDGTDTWFGFYGLPSDSDASPLVFGQREIAGAPAEVSDEANGAMVDLAWGPVNGQTFIAAGSQMTIDDAVAIAEQLRIADGRPVVLDDSVLGGLEPLGPFGDYVTLATLIQYAHNNTLGATGLVGLYYGFDGHSVVSMPGNESALDFVRFVMDTDAEERTVHGRRALGFTKGAGPFGGYDTSTVVWWEGGRLILVAGDGDLSATFDLADTVRPATDEEWAEVEALA